jgi:hypothetical protein
MLSNDGAFDVPTLEPNVVPGLAGSTMSLKFDNPGASPIDPNDGEAQYAEVSATNVVTYQDTTISMWVYSAGGGNWNRIFDMGNDTDNYTFICVNPGSVNRAVRYEVKIAGTAQNVTSPAEAMPDNEWTYVTATLSGDTARIYINGELVGTNEGVTVNPYEMGPTTQNWLGRSQWGAGDGYFNGLIDELKIYNYALSTEQIAQDYLDVRGDWICNQELNDLDFDYDNDCEIGIGDLAYIVEEWVVSYRIYPE